MAKSDFILNIESICVDTLPPFVQLAADTPGAYREIDTLHALESSRYFRAASQSPYYSHPYFIGGGIEREIYARKYLGLLLTAIKEGRNSPLFARVFGIMGKRWESLHEHIQNCNEVVLDDICSLAKPLNSKSLNNRLAEVTDHFLRNFSTPYSAFDQPHQSALKFSLFTACIYGRKVTAKNKERLADIAAFSEKAPASIEFQTIKRRLYSPDIKRMARGLKDSILQQIRSEQANPWSEDRLIEGWAHCWAHILSEEELPFLQHDFRTLPKDRDVELLCRVFFIKMTADWFRDEHICETAEELEGKCAEFVMLGWICLQLLREYKKTRRYYSAHHADHLWREVETQKEKNLQYEERLRQVSEALSAKTYLLDLKDKEFSEQARRHKQEVAALNAEIERLKALAVCSSQTDAAEALSGAADMEKPELSQANFSLPDTLTDLKKLQEVRAVVIGGSEKWQNKLSSHLPHFVYLYGDSAGFDEALVINTDIVFADVRFKFDHDCYYRLADIVRRHNKKLVYLSKTNIPLAVHQMAAAVS